jgi:hypothetical protein
MWWDTNISDDLDAFIFMVNTHNPEDHDVKSYLNEEI